MDPRGFNQYVMHRIGELLETTDAGQWRWVPSKSNAADLSTKIHKKIDSQMWLCGPSFLQQCEEEWPICADLGPTNQSETRKCVLHMHATPCVNMFVEYYSDWRRLYRAVALWILYLAKVNARRCKAPEPTHLAYVHLQRAKLALYKQAQKSTYQSEMCLLSRGHPVERKSSLIALNVYLDKDGVLRMQGRANSLNSHTDAIILPKSHYVTFLIVKGCHEMLHHTSHETAVNLIRSKFYIPKLRVLYKTVRKSCQRCKIDNVKPDFPQMAPLPASRLASHERPFTFTGVDYFGPIMVTVGRHREKRWGVIFTCLTLRAVHLEVAFSLDTNSCIMCLRNFIARRGTPKEIFSDNGTNFKATAKLIREELKNVSFAALQKKFDGIKWRFNPPGAPHMGGSWERLVRSVKTVLHKMCPTERFQDESLRSALCEVEFILNARPLTFVSLDSGDDDALTPNHLLLGSPDGEKILCGDNTDLRTRWRQTQLFADRFWQRWVREYAPNLLRRAKWFTKRPPLRIGDVVIIIDETLPRNSWPKGIVTDIVVAQDGQVRRATVKTQHGLMIRPTAKIAVLDVGRDNCRLAPGLICEGEDVAAENTIA
ncbi:uncharacterized protein LOC118732476 [Rhagoletis pomonella]|uniref:uncharacterized protein LOC118732476 n=1 Tax=Rhagoletis pomonella TaxID=28610 RepID=UPI0017877AE9|nr:uncharacterized protein LOC118732476 [Rhagoletis pomonella]